MAVLTGQGGLRVEVAPHGPDAATTARLAAELLAGDLLAPYLDGTDHRLLAFRVADAGAKGDGARVPPPERFHAVVYDYTNQRTLLVDGRLDDLAGASVRETTAQPVPSDDEFAAAAELARHAAAGGRPDAQVRAWRPMPPFLRHEHADGRVERIVPVGLATATGGRTRHQVVAVNLASGTVQRDHRALAYPDERDCGAPATEDGCAASGETGQVRVAALRHGVRLWDLVVVRPAASSGTNGSGVELRQVDYRGTRVLWQAHVPILNVRYPNGGCAEAYRDWQRSEACFHADGEDVIPGFRLCPRRATTVLDSGGDGGNFRGVALWLDRDEVVIVSELQAGWYRYVSEWRLAANGAIRPRFGFAATSNPCTCHDHVHHAYWRFDFDIQTSGGNLVEEYNDPPLDGQHVHIKHYEVRRRRDPARTRHWRVRNAASGAGYALVPGPDDGTRDGFGVGDVWVLRYRDGEIDDGQGFTTDPSLAVAHLDDFLSGEPVEDADVVVWYAGHFSHDVMEHAGGQRLGPDLVPFDWPAR
jgi:hypothetical protein